MIAVWIVLTLAVLVSCRMTVLELAWRSVVDWIQIKCLGLTVEYSMPHYIKYINKDQQMHKYQSERQPIKRSILP